VSAGQARVYHSNLLLLLLCCCYRYAACQPELEAMHMLWFNIDAK
jgi:hypothetical protein